MSKIIYFLLCGIVGGVFSTLDINITNWQFWVVVSCMSGAYICGRITEKK